MPRLEPKILYAAKDGANPHELVIRNDLTWASAYIRGDRFVVMRKHPILLTPYEKNYKIIHKMALNQDQSLSAERDRRYVDYLDPERRVSDEDLPMQVLNAGLESGFCKFRLHWKKVINEGGFGLVTLFEAEFEDGHRMDVVVKLPKGDTPMQNVIQERHWHERYAGAQCIVQGLDLNVLADKYGFFDRFWRGEEFIDEDQNVIVLEHMRHGNLRVAFQKASYLGLAFPNNALWQLWECLVIGIAEVAYQREFEEILNRPFTLTLGQEIKNGEAALEAFFQYVREDLTMSHDVHFDLEESNILVDMDEDGNVILKLHDFGPDWSKDMRFAWEKWNAKHYWSMRKEAKTGKHLPEQHVIEWNRLPYPDNDDGGFRFASDDLGDDDSKTKTAGRYGSWTNVYIIARTLHSAITLCYAHHPFRAKKGHPDDEMDTYGWRMDEEKFPHVDPDLLEIVRRCMREAPVDRDDIEQLLRDIIDAQSKGKMVRTPQSDAFWESVLQPWPEILAEGDQAQRNASDPSGPSGPQGSAGNGPDPGAPHGGTGNAQGPAVPPVAGGAGGNGGGPAAQPAPVPKAGSAPLPTHQALVLRPKKKYLKSTEPVKRAASKKLHTRVQQYAGRMAMQAPAALQNLTDRSEALET